MADSQIHVQEVKGNLDLDSPLESIKNGDYVEAFNVSMQSQLRREGDKAPCVGVLAKPYVFRSKLFPSSENSRYELYASLLDTVLTYNWGSMSCILKQKSRTADEIYQKALRDTYVYLIRRFQELPGVTTDDERILGLCDQWEIMEMAIIPGVSYIDRQTSVTGYMSEGEPVLILANRDIGLCELRLADDSPGKLISMTGKQAEELHPILYDTIKEQSYAPPGVTCYAVRFKRKDGSYSKFSDVTDLLAIPYSYGHDDYGASNVVYTAADFNPNLPTIKSAVVPVICIYASEWEDFGIDNSCMAELFATRFFNNDGLIPNESTAITHLVDEAEISGSFVLLFDGRKPPITTNTTWKEIKEQSFGVTAFDSAKVVCCKEGVLYAANVMSRDDSGAVNDTIEYDAKAWQFNYVGLAVTADGYWHNQVGLLSKNQTIDPERNVLWNQCDIHTNYNDMTVFMEDNYKTDIRSKYTVFGELGYHGAIGPNVTIYFSRGKMDIGGVYPEIAMNHYLIERQRLHENHIATDPRNKIIDWDTSSRIMRGLNAPSYDVGCYTQHRFYDDVDPNTRLKKHTKYSISVPNYQGTDKFGEQFPISRGDDATGHSFANTSFEAKFKALQHDSVYYFGVYFTKLDGTYTDIYVIGDLRTPSMSDPEFRLFDDHVLCEEPKKITKTLEQLYDGHGSNYDIYQYTEIKAYPVYMYVQLRNIPSGVTKAHIVYKRRQLDNMNVKATGVIHMAMKPFDKETNGDRDVLTVRYADLYSRALYLNYSVDSSKGTWCPKGSEGSFTPALTVPNGDAEVPVKGLVQDYYKNGKRYSLTPIPHLGKQAYFYGGIISHCSTDENFSKYRNNTDGTIQDYRVSNKNKEVRPAGGITNVVINTPEERCCSLGPYFMSRKAAFDGSQYSFGQYNYYSGRRVIVNSGNADEVLLFHCPELDFTNSEGKALIPFDFDVNVSTYFDGHGFLTSLFPAGVDKGMLSYAYSELNDGFGKFYGMNLWKEDKPILYSAWNETAYTKTYDLGKMWKLWSSEFDYGNPYGAHSPVGMYDCLMITNNYTTTCRTNAFSRLIQRVKEDPDIPTDITIPLEVKELYSHYCIGSMIQSQSHHPYSGLKYVTSGSTPTPLESAIIAGGDLGGMISYAQDGSIQENTAWKLTIADSRVQYNESGDRIKGGVPPRCLKYFIRHTTVELDSGDPNLSDIEEGHRVIIKISNPKEIDLGIKDFDRQFKYLWPCSYNKEVRFGTPNPDSPVSAAGVDEVAIEGKTFVNLSPLWSGKTVPAYNDGTHNYIAPDSIVSSSDRNRMHGLCFLNYALGATQDNMPSFPISTPDAFVTPIADHGDTLNTTSMNWYRSNSSDLTVWNHFEHTTWGFNFPVSAYAIKSVAAPSSVYYSLCTRERLELESVDLSESAPAGGGHVYPDVVWDNWQGSLCHYRETPARDMKTVNTSYDKPYLWVPADIPIWGEAFNNDVWCKIEYGNTPNGTICRFNYWAGSVTFDYFCGVNHHGWGGRMLGATLSNDFDQPRFLTEDFDFPHERLFGSDYSRYFLKDELWDGSGRNIDDQPLQNDKHKLYLNDPRPMFPALDADYYAGKKNLASNLMNSINGIAKGLSRGSTLLMVTYRTPSVNYTRSDWDNSMWVETYTPTNTAMSDEDFGLIVSNGQAQGHITGFDTFVGIHKKLYTHAFYPSMEKANGTKESATPSSPTIMMFPYEGMINVDIANELEDILKSREQKAPLTNRRQWLQRDVTYAGEDLKIKMKTDAYGYNAVFSSTNSSTDQSVKDQINKPPTNSSRIYYSIYNALYRDFDIFRPGNYCDLDDSYGAINNMGVMGNNLFVFQENAVAIFNPMMPMAISGGQGQPVIFTNASGRNVAPLREGFAEGDIIDMGDGSILAGRFQYAIKGFGIAMHNSDAVFANDDGIYWVDTNSRAILRANAQGAEDIGKKYNADAWAAAVSSIINITPGATYYIYGTHDKAVRFCCTEPVDIIGGDWFNFGKDQLSHHVMDKRCIQLEEMGGGFNSFISFIPETVMMISNNGVYDIESNGLLLFEGGHNAYFLPVKEDIGMSLTSFVNIPGADVMDKYIYSCLWRYKNASSIDRIIEARPHTPIGLTKINMCQVYHYEKKDSDKVTEKYGDGDNKNEFTQDMSGSGEKEFTRGGQSMVSMHSGSLQQGYVSATLKKELVGIGGMGVFIRHRFQTMTPRCSDEFSREPSTNKNIVTPWKKRYWFYFGPFVVCYDMGKLF